MQSPLETPRPFYSRCGPGPSLIDLLWELVRNTAPRAHTGPTGPSFSSLPGLCVFPRAPRPSAHCLGLRDLKDGPSTPRLRPGRLSRTRSALQVLSKASALGFQVCKAPGRRPARRGSVSLRHRASGGCRVKKQKQPGNAGELTPTRSRGKSCWGMFVGLREEAARTGGAVRPDLSALTLSTIIWIFFPFGPREGAATQRV